MTHDKPQISVDMKNLVLDKVLMNTFRVMASGFTNVAGIAAGTYEFTEYT